MITHETAPLQLGAKQQGSRFTPLPKTAQDGQVVGHAIQIIRADAHTLYQVWRDLASIPRWQEHVISVTPVTASTSHWVMGDPEDPKGKRLEFDSEITEDMPGSKVAWTSITEGVDLSGAVTFEPVERGTRVTLIQNVKVPGGSLGNAFAALLKRSPRQTVIEDLRHFKQLAETGEIPSVKGQPHGPRGISGGIKEWMYGETNPTPPGTSEPGTSEPGTREPGTSVE